MRAALIFAWLILTSIVCWYMLDQNDSVSNSLKTSLKSNSEIQVIDEASGSSYTDNIDEDQSETKEVSDSQTLDNKSELSSVEMTTDSKSDTNQNVKKSITRNAESNEDFDFLEKTYIQFNKNDFKLAPIPNLNTYLDSVANVLNNSDLSVLLVGHADQSKSRKYDNIAVGVKRANAVKTELLKRNVKAEKITIESKGDSEPRIQGNTPEAKAKNRRVELFLKQNN